jgi:glycosyltransferase involved in cell wall biosynthesis
MTGEQRPTTLRVLLFNLGTDADDAILGFTTTWINALAERCTRIVVITMYAGRLQVRSNVVVHSVGKERGYSELRRLFEFYRLLFISLRRERVDVCFAHMAPLFALLFAPIAKLRRIPIVLWYAHKSTPITLRLAHAVVDRCLASTPEGFRLPSRKVSFIGQGVDTTVFHPPHPRPADYELMALSIGRFAPIKKLDELIEAVAQLREAGVSLELRLTGGPLTPRDREYCSALRRQQSNLGLRDAVTFEGFASFQQIPSHYRRGGIFVSLSESGSLDKAIVESMASGCIPICRNDAFRGLAADHGFEQLVPGQGSREVAECLGRVIGLAQTEKDELRTELRSIVVREHSLERLAARIFNEMSHLRRID